MVRNLVKASPACWEKLLGRAGVSRRALQLGSMAPATCALAVRLLSSAPGTCELGVALGAWRSAAQINIELHWDEEFRSHRFSVLQTVASRLVRQQGPLLILELAPHASPEAIDGEDNTFFVELQTSDLPSHASVQCPDPHAPPLREPWTPAPSQLPQKVPSPAPPPPPPRSISHPPGPPPPPALLGVEAAVEMLPPSTRLGGVASSRPQEGLQFAPLYLAAQSITPASVTVNWVPPQLPPGAPPIRRYIVAHARSRNLPATGLSQQEVYPLSNPFKCRSETDSCLVGALAAATEYSFWVAAIDDMGLGAWSEPMVVSTAAPLAAPHPPMEAPKVEADHGEGVVCTSEAHLLLPYPPPANSQTWVVEKRCYSTGGRWMPAASIPLDNAVKIQLPSESELCRFRVRAMNSLGVSEPSPESDATFPDGTSPAAAPLVRVTSSASIMLDWGHGASLDSYSVADGRDGCRSTTRWTVEFRKVATSGDVETSDWVTLVTEIIGLRVEVCTAACVERSCQFRVGFLHGAPGLPPAFSASSSAIQTARMQSTIGPGAAGAEQQCAELEVRRGQDKATGHALLTYVCVAVMGVGFAVLFVLSATSACSRFCLPCKRGRKIEHAGMMDVMGGSHGGARRIAKRGGSTAWSAVPTSLVTDSCSDGEDVPEGYDPHMIDVFDVETTRTLRGENRPNILVAGKSPDCMAEKESKRIRRAAGDIAMPCTGSGSNGRTRLEKLSSAMGNQGCVPNTGAGRQITNPRSARSLLNDDDYWRSEVWGDAPPQSAVLPPLPPPPWRSISTDSSRSSRLDGALPLAPSGEILALMGPPPAPRSLADRIADAATYAESHRAVD